jgi:proteasome lid subunit RPN8/RPN11
MEVIIQLLDKEEFEECCIEFLSTILAQFNYSHANTYVRAKGIAVEFINGENSFFAVNEEDALYFDLIAKIDSVFYRISLNQALWFQGIHSLPKCSNWKEQLQIFKTELKTRCSNILKGNASAVDERYCFAISNEDKINYIETQKK